MNDAPQPESSNRSPLGENRYPANARGAKPVGGGGYKRRYKIPILLFIATCFSTFWVGIAEWQPIQQLTAAHSDGSMMRIRVLLLDNWEQGLIYAFAVLLILFAHEMGHFIATLIYKVPASAPIFLPFPINPLGTLGAVIAMQGNAADRKQIFDIGLAGPLAGLIPCIPIAFLLSLIHI